MKNTKIKLKNAHLLLSDKNSSKLLKITGLFINVKTIFHSSTLPYNHYKDTLQN